MTRADLRNLLRGLILGLALLGFGMLLAMAWHAAEIPHGDIGTPEVTAAP